MEYEIYSYRYAEEIIDHPKFVTARNEITKIIIDCPIFIWPKKSKTNNELNVLQQLLNAYFDVKFACLNSWKFHPLASDIPNSGLKADFKKSFDNLGIQSEIQFGNMARWYSDIFKFQTAYSQNMIDMGLSIVPFQKLANRIDSNVAYYERCIKELPSAKLSITLPILMIGINQDNKTDIVDVSQTHFNNISKTEKYWNQKENRYRIVHGYLSGESMENISIQSPTGLMP
jgi:hypothetical protein